MEMNVTNITTGKFAGDYSIFCEHTPSYGGTASSFFRRTEEEMKALPLAETADMFQYVPELGFAVGIVLKNYPLPSMVVRIEGAVCPHCGANNGKVAEGHYFECSTCCARVKLSTLRRLGGYHA